MENTNKKLTLTREVDASREAVWAAWTDAKAIAQWWGPNGVTNPTCDWDAQVGGLIHIVMLAGDELGPMKGSKWPMKGVFTEVVAPERLVFTSDPYLKDGDEKPFMETVTTVTFEPDGGAPQKTKMTVHIEVTKAGPEAAGPLSGMEMGWNQQMDKFVKFLGK